MAKIGRSFDELDQRIKSLNSNIKQTDSSVKALDKDLKMKDTKRFMALIFQTHETMIW